MAGCLSARASGGGADASWPVATGVSAWETVAAVPGSAAGMAAVALPSGWTVDGGGAAVSRDTVTGDTLVLFHFVPGRLMFYREYPGMEGNAGSIAAVARLIDRHREAIEAGHAVVRVRGYCGSFADGAANLRAAKNRSNQVKSWFITRHGMKEEYYKTSNSTRPFRGMGDVVAVVGVEYLEGFEPPRDTVAAVPPVDTLKTEPEPVVEPEPEPAPQPADTVAEEPAPEPVAEPVVERVRIPLAVKTNLLYDLLLLPTVEAEYLFNERWSLNVEGSVAWWRIDGGVDKYYDLWIVSPEVRYWFKTKDRWHGHHGGFFVGAGAYDLENGKQGYKGEYFMTGLAYGFMFPVKGCRSLHMEANIGVGYMYTEYEEYLPIDGHYVYQETGRTNYVGPLKAKFSLVWVLDLWKKKGGKK